MEKVTINAPEAIKAGDKVEMQYILPATSTQREQTRTNVYTVRNIIFGLKYDGDEGRRIVLTFEEHRGALCLPNIPLDTWDNNSGFLRVYRETADLTDEQYNAVVKDVPDGFRGV